MKTRSVAIVLENWPAGLVDNFLGLLEEMGTVPARGSDGQMVSCTRDDRPPAYWFTPDDIDLEYLMAASATRQAAAGPFDVSSDEERDRYAAARAGMSPGHVLALAR